MRGARRMIGGIALGALTLTACGKPPYPAAAVGSAVRDTPSPLPSSPPSVARPALLADQNSPFGPPAVKRLRHVPGVSRIALIGYGQVWVYDQQIPTASVDPVSYRPFTPFDTREPAGVWAALTDGNALVSHAAAARGHLALDTRIPAGRDTVRIAGLATTVPGIDMVVTATTGERLGVPYGNGLVIEVSGDPVRTMARVRAVLGKGATVRRVMAGPDRADPAADGPILPVVTPTAAPVVPPVPPAAPPVPAVTPTPRATPRVSRVPTTPASVAR
jgi:hypothetical protein